MKDGPPPNRTGGFGGESCHMCHNDSPVNEPGGSLTISGVPEKYAAGQTYRLTVVLAREGMRRGGFQLAARNAEGMPVGRWKALDGRTAVAGRFVQHTAAGTEVSAGAENRWEVEWTAPAAGAGTVIFNAAANAANDDASPLGDHIYTGEWKSAGQ